MQLKIHGVLYEAPFHMAIIAFLSTQTFSQLHCLVSIQSLVSLTFPSKITFNIKNPLNIKTINFKKNICSLKAYQGKWRSRTQDQDLGTLGETRYPGAKNIKVRLRPPPLKWQLCFLYFSYQFSRHIISSFNPMLLKIITFAPTDLTILLQKTEELFLLRQISSF